MSTPMMKCGHAANAVDGNGNPSCVICIGIDPGASIIDDAAPDLSARKARCTYYGSIPNGRSHESNYGCKRNHTCLCEQPSSADLPFFHHNSDKPYDEFYCGCWGWD